jgi:hypothetical protein
MKVKFKGVRRYPLASLLLTLSWETVLATNLPCVAACVVAALR